jgi:hypothetical protein
MAIGKASDFKIYDEQIHGGLVETLVQNTAAFNAASRGAIRLVNHRLPGNYAYESFVQTISGLITRRDTTSVAVIADTPVAQAEMISVKLNRKIGPVAQTLDAFRKLGSQGNVNSLSFLIGTQIAKAMQIDQLDTALMSVTASLLAQTATNKLVIATNGTLATAGLVSGCALLGDAAEQIVIWVMHSKPYYDLVQSQITANIDGISNFVVANASPVTLNRPVLVTDSASLIKTTGAGSTLVTDYYTLGLVVGAVTAEDSEEELIHAELITGLENLVVRLQGEFAYNLSVKGAQWDVGNGGPNPSNAALATTTNWDKVATSYKNLAGVVIQSR